MRWAFVLFIVLGLAYFPLNAGFRFYPATCEFALNAELARLSLTKWAHIVLFGIFFVVSVLHFRASHWPDRNSFIIAAVLTIAMGALVELGEGVTRTGSCRLRDLVPDGAGAALAGLVLFIYGVASRKLRKAVVGKSAQLGRPPSAG